MKRIFCTMTVWAMALSGTAWAQQSELAELKAELQKQQEAIAGLIKKVEALEKKQTNTVSREELKQEAQTQQETVNSLRESFLSKVNLAGYYNFRYVNDDSPVVGSFQQQNLALLLSKQLQRWNFLLEVELQNVPHHREILPTEGEGEGEKGTSEDISAEGAFSVENAWMEYNHSRNFNVRFGKQLAPQYWWSHRYPNLTYSTTVPIHLRDLFPPELVGGMIYGSAAKPVGTSEFGFGYKFYVANNEVPNSSLGDLRDRKAVGGRMEFRMPVKGRLKRFDFATDLYSGRIGLSKDMISSDTVWGFEEQIEWNRFSLYGEYARGNNLGARRFGYYLQPAARLSDQWLAFYRVERLSVPSAGRDETRHLAGINFRPFPQIALKLEYVRSLLAPEEFTLSPSESRRNRSNGVATSAVFFF